MKRNFFTTILFIFVCFELYGLEVTLTLGTIKPTPIAVTDFYSKDNKVKKIGKNISTIISDNLERSGLFLPIDKKAFVQDADSLSDQPRFEDWKLIKAQHLISGKIFVKKDKISVEFRLFDVLAQKQLIGKRYKTVALGLIHKLVIGFLSCFDTKIFS